MQTVDQPVHRIEEAERPLWRRRKAGFRRQAEIVELKLGLLSGSPLR